MHKYTFQPIFDDGYKNKIKKIRKMRDEMVKEIEKTGELLPKVNTTKPYEPVFDKSKEPTNVVLFTLKTYSGSKKLPVIVTRID